jgi:hypothetical protein
MKKNNMGLNCPLWIVALTAAIAFVMVACGSADKDAVDNSKFYLKAPTGIVATKLSNDRVHLTWNAVPGAGSYEIRVRTNLDSADTRLSGGSTYNTSYEHGYYSWYWYYYARPEQVTTVYYYLKTYPSKAGYIESGWSEPVSVDIP